MIKTKVWIGIIALVAAVCAALTVFIFAGRRKGRTVEIVSDGKVVMTVDLDRVTEETTYDIPAPGGGHNLVTVAPGKICVSEADCPDKTCVRMGWLSDGNAPIVCLPHKLVIRPAGGSQGADAEAR
ncbi:MAG: NusG domain II-containing protein [Clostridia bacterium]|nr:NusG domain II-containing protein [Clostridia bacterium]MBR6289909.1 NusG domain II-containing protein [Clostridia bacterium]